ncbi:UNVERIFIED_ASMBLY: HNH endonuclease [Shigella phage 2019SD1]|uniref:HNH endonuclease n=1 Tax=Shigella phage 2019SD1 TaxID=2848074 RepID=A0A6M5CAQ0_9CAUD|nr:HNH endonuclease [Shigella phage 2019SD1]
MHNGKIPEGMEIDHIWHNRWDNRIENLRLASRLENSKNVSLLKRNKSGRVGVCWRKKERWRNRRGKAKHGSVAGCVDKNGYVRIRYNGVLLLAHRIIWEMHNGKIPEGMEIDHIWHNRWDNRIENLRLASRLENSKNVSLLKRNKSGRVGVCWRKKEKMACNHIHIFSLELLFVVY